MIDKSYKLPVQGLYKYFIHRVKLDLEYINHERREEELDVEKTAQELVNYIVDSNQFKKFVDQIILEKAIVK